jgi:hypothetical protein
LQSIALQADSGAAKSITGNLSEISNYIPFTEPKYMYTITGSRISVFGSGTIGIIRAFYSPDADSGVIATKELQKRGMMTIFPLGENSGVWIVDPTTRAIVIQGDKNYNINPDILHSLAPAGDKSNKTVISRREIQDVYG